MALHRQLLIEQDTRTNLDEFVWSANELPGTPGGWSVRLRTCRGGLSEGVQVVEVNNGPMTVAVVPTRGMGIWHAQLEGRNLGWQSPVRGPVHPAWVPTHDPSGLGWLEGFNELVCRCGLESNGAPQFDEAGRLQYPLHGRIANLPASVVEVAVDDTAGTIALTGVVEETRFHFQKLRLTATLTVPFERSQFTWDDEVTNFGGARATMQMLYHTNIGEPFLQPGCQLVAPVVEVAPSTQTAAGGIAQWQTYAPGVAGAGEKVYFFDLAADAEQNTQVLLKNAAGAEGIALRWNQRTLPRFIQWKNEAASADGYVTGLEPATNFPNPRSFEEAHDRVVHLQPGESWRGAVSLDWLTTASAVNKSEQAVATLQGDRAPEVFDAPRGDWSPGG